MKGKAVLVPLIAVVVVSVVMFAAVNMMAGNIQKEAGITGTMAPGPMEIVRGRTVDHETYETAHELWDPAGWNKYVYLEQGSPDPSHKYRYDGRVNKLLGTEEYVTDGSLDGIIVGNSSQEVVGQFPNGSYAVRMDRELFFVKLPEQVIVRHVVLRGGDPPMKVKKTQYGSNGKWPSAKEIAAAIRAELD
ncbi:MAG: hypothetical protein LUD76_02240 [Alistipes sp.]|nr:hypothetical protein [Alistipes sp.]